MSLTPSGTPTVVVPQVVTGIQVSGEWTGETNQVGYFATVSNGRGPSDAYADLDNNKGIVAQFIEGFSFRSRTSIAALSDPSIRNLFLGNFVSN